jgi:hypothetical protein
MRKNACTPSALTSESPQERDRAICRQRYQAEMRRLEKLSKRLASAHLRDDQREALQEELSVLSIEPRRQLRILLSWGGPSDGYLLTFDAEGRDLLDGCHWYADWFTYAEEELSPSDRDRVCDLYLGGDPSVYFERSRS